MSSNREVVPLNVADVSVFAKSLRQHLIERAKADMAEKAEPPSHLQFLNLIAKSAGFRNFQTLRAASKPDQPLGFGVPLDPSTELDLPKTVQRALRQFDRYGRLLKWPTQFAVQRLALWAIWTRLPAKRDLTERDVNDYIDKYQGFGDAVTLRRELVNMKMLWRTTDGRVYRKQAVQPSDEARVFLSALLKLTANEKSPLGL